MIKMLGVWRCIRKILHSNTPLDIKPKSMHLGGEYRGTKLPTAN